MATSEEIRLIIKTEMDAALRDIKSFNTELTNTDKKSKTSERSLASMAVSAIGLGTAIYAVTDYLKESVKAASDLEETTSKFNVTFSAVSSEAENVARRLVDVYGLSTQESKKLLASTGDLLTGFGFTGAAALQMSKQINELAVDLASFQNLQGGAEQASNALTRAMTGEREMLKTLGIVVQEEMITQRLYQQGKQNLTGTALLQAKAEETLKMALEQSKNAIGDAVRTQDSYANVMRRVQSRTEDLKAELGGPLMDALKNLGISFLQSSKDGGFLHDFMKAFVADIADAVNRINSLFNLLNNFDVGKLKDIFEPKRVKEFNKAVGEAKIKEYRTEIENLNAAMGQTDDIETRFEIQRKITELQGMASAAEKEYALNVTKTTSAVVTANQQQLQSVDTSSKAQVEARKKAIEDFNEYTRTDAERRIAKEVETFTRINETIKLNDAQKTLFEQQFQENIKLIRDQYDQQERVRQTQGLNDFLTATQTTLSVATNIFAQYYRNKQLMMEQEQRNYNRQRDAISKHYDDLIAEAKKNGQDTTALEEEKQAKIDEINRQAERRRKQLAREIAVYEKTNAIITATINTAIAVSKAYAQGGFFGGPVMAGIIAALGAAQIALIAKQPLPPAAQEGAIIPGSGSGTIVRAGENNRPEAIIPLTDDRAGGRGLGGTTLVVNVQNLYGADSLPRELVQTIDRELTRLHQDSNSTFSQVIR